MFNINWDNIIEKDVNDKNKELAKKAIQGIKHKKETSEIGFMNVNEGIINTERLISTSKWIQDNADDFVVLGIGGSSLGGKTIVTALNNKFNKKGIRVHFIDNVDPDYFTDLLNSIDLKRTVFNVISKSGSTAETMAQFLVVYRLLFEKLGKKEAVSRIILTTDPKKGALRPLENSMGFKTLDVPQNIGGRFCALTDVGLLPAAVAGIDVKSLLKGAGEMANRSLTDDLVKNQMLEYSIVKYIHALKGYDISVLMPYSTKLFDFSLWYVQLWAESLGKQGKGQTPIPATGATDQHSQVQLFMEGPKDKLITFIGIKEHSNVVNIPDFETPIEAFSYLSGHTMKELLDAEMNSTQKALYENKVPSVKIELPKLDAYNLGALMMFFELATATTGEFMGINAFDQPGVELGKKYTYQMMGRKGY